VVKESNADIKSIITSSQFDIANAFHHPMTEPIQAERVKISSKRQKILSDLINEPKNNTMNTQTDNNVF
jgi:hypothetical protein